ESFGPDKAGAHVEAGERRPGGVHDDADQRHGVRRRPEPAAVSDRNPTPPDETRELHMKSLIVAVVIAAVGASVAAFAAEHSIRQKGKVFSESAITIKK